MTIRLILLIILALCLLPEFAMAHSAFKGANTFFNGLLHPVVVVGHLLLILATGLLFGQQGLEKSEKSIVIFLAAVVSGLLLSDFLRVLDLELYLLTFAVVAGLLVAIRPRIPVYMFTILGAVSGLMIGLDSSQEDIAGIKKAFAFLGNAVGITVLILYPVAIVDNFNNRVWQVTGVRIIGSWIAASAFLVMTLSMSNVLS